MGTGIIFMKKSMVNNLVKVTAALGACVAISAQAENVVKGAYIAPSLGYHLFDNDRSLDDEVSYGFALGNQMTENWAVELAYNMSKTQSPSVDVDVDYLHLDALYQFTDEKTSSSWTPYIVFGVGEVAVNAENSTKVTDVQWNAGLGVKYAINSNLSLRTDVRGLLVADEVNEDTLVNIGLVYAFGKAKAKSVAPAPVTQKVEPVTAPAVAVVEKDSDEDGVFDSKDKCPDSAKGSKVDADGCYVALEGDKEFALNVKFQSGKSVIQPDSKGQIAELAEFLTSYPQTNTTVEGHTDSVGSAEYNKALSQQRAEAVRQSLINDYKIAAERVAAVGYGEEKPIADNATAEGQAQNRRVVAKVSTKK
jgi:OmpA-OmpF porin, OOP family